MYQHYKNQDLTVKGARFPLIWIYNYIEKQKPSESIETLLSRVQTMAVGSVLIATVTFTAALNPPGGYNNSNGTAVFGGKHLFRAFIVADTAAFTFSFISTLYLIYLGAIRCRSSIENKLHIPRIFFAVATIYMVLAFQLGVYLLVGAVIDLLSIGVGSIFAGMILVYFGSISWIFETAQKIMPRTWRIVLFKCSEYGIWIGCAVLPLALLGSKSETKNCSGWVRRVHLCIPK